ncbi:YveK family protein [Liquorilactobacillus oeni]|uniref:Capsular polysaccharide biosynthesis protein CpsC n=1 Tax=Liquorilactobacillus oeni DSM 19972 TaxID=1423777 RepID=A0A0R1MHI5_9LACO|nr:Wzz/FepE/Etk N-terminal domain-containing protein [Liquorilactobacillus oeni]KRL04570.1 Exopolysaccharide chain length regulator [Liquorilactobacillus oeni DSM 19972]
MKQERSNDFRQDVKKITGLLRQNLHAIVLWGFLGGFIALLFSFFFITPRYSATSVLLVNQKTDDSQMQYAAQQADLQAINTYKDKDILTREVILKPVLKQLQTRDNYVGGIQDLEKSLAISNQTDSQVLSIEATDRNPYTATDLANTIATVFSKKIVRMMKINNVSILAKAAPSTVPVVPNKKLNLLLGVLLGLFLGCVIAVIRTLMDTTIKDESFLKEELGLVSLGVISHIKSKEKRHAVKALQAAKSGFKKRV